MNHILIALTHEPREPRADRWILEVAYNGVALPREEPFKSVEAALEVAKRLMALERSRAKTVEVLPVDMSELEP
jgi:hypothetical protein